MLKKVVESQLNFWYGSEIAFESDISSTCVAYLDDFERIVIFWFTLTIVLKICKVLIDDKHSQHTIKQLFKRIDNFRVITNYSILISRRETGPN